MKKIILTLAIACSGLMNAQTESKPSKLTIPIVVKENFAKEFPEKKAKWEAEEGGYEAEFKINGKDASAVYDKKGHRKAVEVALKSNELPANAISYLKQNYPKNKIIESAKITDDKNVITFEAEIKKEGQSYDILFDANGKFLKIVKGD